MGENEYNLNTGTIFKFYKIYFQIIIPFSDFYSPLAASLDARLGTTLLTDLELFCFFLLTSP